MFRITRSRIDGHRFGAAQQLAVGGMVLAFLTWLCFWLQFDLATTGLVYLILIALLSLMGSFIASAVLSIIAIGCLGYFFAPPLFNFQIDAREDILAAVAFLTASIIITGLTTKIRNTAEEAQTAQKAIIDTIPALVWTALPDGSRDFHNQHWLATTGRSGEEANGDRWSAFVHPDDQAAVMDRWRLSVATGEPFEVEGRGLRSDGEYRWFLARAQALRDDKGNIVKWYGSSVDIEDRKRATDALRESETQWREVFEHNPVMYFMLDPTGTVLSVNGFGAAQLGYTADELVGQSVFKVFFEEDREFVRGNVAACLENVGRSHSWEGRKVRKDGTVLWVRENAKAVRSGAKQPIVLVACEDVTERKRAAEELHEAQTELAHAIRLTTLGEMTASIAHEVNQPLAAVVTHAEACLRWLERETPDLDEVREAVESIIKDGKRAGEVIRRVRGLAHKTATQKTPLDLNDVVREVVALVEHELLSRRVSLRMELTPALPPVLADRVQLQQVIINLMMNGIEAMQAVTDRPRDLVIRSCQDEEHEVLLSVQDRGTGISAESADRLFKAFFTTKSSGMGMGLSICRSIIEAHGGRVWAVPNVPHGAAFHFTLPVNRGDAA
ncbi:MAG TPA: PAS domain S-box protein [Bradyrhizobium sp.]|nr:PAS domain S-box protein [Bradyrhizobium sp.]